ncbi:hypothetical protein EV361DRAFT_981740 [Lentinula raphanica]|nr:hypothetical protein EV361DRAFT_981740 [Lentinula raphanica]
MIPNCSTASRRALAIFVLSAVLSSSVLAAPTIHPRTLSLSLSESDPTSTQTSSGPGSLSGGGHLATTLQGPKGVEHSNVVIRQDGPDGLQGFKDFKIVEDSAGSNLDPLASADLEQRSGLSKRGGCLSICDSEPNAVSDDTELSTYRPGGAKSTAAKESSANDKALELTGQQRKDEREAIKEELPRIRRMYDQAQMARSHGIDIKSHGSVTEKQRQRKSHRLRTDARSLPIHLTVLCEASKMSAAARKIKCKDFDSLGWVVCNVPPNHSANAEEPSLGPQGLNVQRSTLTAAGESKLSGAHWLCYGVGKEEVAGVGEKNLD